MDKQCLDEHGELYYIGRTREGDRNSFSHLVEAYSDRVYTLCLRMLGREDEAKDAAQDAFVKAFRSLNNFREESRFSTWLYRIAYNHCISVIRKNVRVIDLVDERDQIEEQDMELNALDLLGAADRSVYLKTAIEALPETDAVMVNLFYYDELSLEEIAKITGLSSGNIRIRLHRSRKKLYEVLSGLLKNELHSIA